MMNSLQTCVDDMLKGVLLLHPHLRQLGDTKTVVRKDIMEYRESGKVTIVTGGGSGHEPSFPSKQSKLLKINMSENQ